MTKFYLFLVLLIVSNTFAQEKTYTFSKNRLQQVRKFSYNINPLKLKQTSIKIARFDTIKTITNEYAAVLAENEELKKDSLKELIEFNNKSIEFKKLQSIVSNLNLFLSSEDKFKIKKAFLITAQKISDSLIDKKTITSLYGQKTIYDKGNESSLLYSDGEFNSNFKKEFNGIYTNEKSLNEYYKNKVSKILNIRKPSFNWERKKYNRSISSTLDTNPKKYDLSFVKKDSISISGFEGVEFDYLTLNGSFMKIDKYYQKNNNVILLEENIKNINFKLNNFYEMNNTGRTLLQNTETKEYILVSGSLLSEYENTKNEEDLKEFNDGYLIWKTKYTELTKSAENNITICNSILKRNTFINVLGQSVWNADKISKKDKLEFNNNYDAITEKLSKLGVLEQERKFYSYYLDNVKGDEKLNVYGISIFHSTAQKFTIK